MKRNEALQKLLALKREFQAISVVTMGAIPEWHELGGADIDNLDVTGMGLASSVGLGIALARPDRFVMVIDGDGSLLMELGSLLTIYDANPQNFVHFILCNGIYETTGGQKIPDLKRGQWVWNQIPEKISLGEYNPYWLEIDPDTPRTYPKLDLPKQVKILQESLKNG